MTKGEIAKQNFLNGLTCTQAVVATFAEDYGLDMETMLLMAQPFGGGMGRLREVCGTFSGMLMILGIAKGSTTDKSAKARIYKDVQALAERFRKDNGSIICRELLGLRTKGNDSPIPSERTPEYYASRPCPELCRYAADLLDEYLKSYDETH